MFAFLDLHQIAAAVSFIVSIVQIYTLAFSEICGKYLKRKEKLLVFQKKKLYYNAFSNMSDTSLLKLNQGLVLSE